MAENGSTKTIDIEIELKGVQQSVEKFRTIIARMKSEQQQLFDTKNLKIISHYVDEFQKRYESAYSSIKEQQVRINEAVDKGLSYDKEKAAAIERQLKSLYDLRGANRDLLSDYKQQRHALVEETKEQERSAKAAKRKADAQAKAQAAQQRTSQYSADQLKMQESRERIANQRAIQRERDRHAQAVHDFTVANNAKIIEAQRNERVQALIADRQAAREFKAQQTALKLAQQGNKDRINLANAASTQILRATDGLYKTLKSSLKGTLTDAKKLYSTFTSEISTIMHTLSLDEYSNIFSTQTLRDALTNASALVESENLLNQMYEKDAQSLMDWAANSSYAYGLSANNARTYVSQVSAMLQNLGIENEDIVEEMSMSYTKMAGDLASAFNVSTDTAYAALRSGISGMVRPLEKFGINLKISALNEWVEMNGIADELGNKVQYMQLSEYNKQLVRYAYLMEKTRDIQGDYGETFNSWANSIKTLKNEWSNFLDIIGNFAIPVIKPVLEWTLKAIKSLEYLIQVLGELLGLESYAEDYDRFAYIEEETNDTADNIDDANDNLEKLNKTAKKGAKLLDLYELNFGDDTNSGSGASPINKEDLDLSKEFYDQISKYKDVIPDFDIAIDREGIREFAQALVDSYNAAKSLFNTVWNFKLFGLPSLHELYDWLVDSFKKDPAGTLATILKTIFALNLIKSALKNIVWPNIQKAISESAIGKSIATAIVGSVLAAFGGFNMGDFMVNRNESSLWWGLGLTFAGTIISAIAGALVAGLPGAIAGAVGAIGLAELALAAGVAFEQANNAAESAVSFMQEGAPLVIAKANEIKAAFGSDSSTLTDKSIFDNYTLQVDNLNEDINKLETETLPSLIAKMSVMPGDETTANRLSKQFDTLRDKIIKADEKQREFSVNVLTSMLSEEQTKLSGVNPELATYVDNLGKIIELQKEEELNRLKDLQLRASGVGRELKPEEEKELEFLKQKYNLVEQVSDLLPEINTTFDATADSFNNFKERMDTGIKSLQEGYNTAVSILDDGVKRGLITPEAYTLERDELDRLFSERYTKINESLETAYLEYANKMERSLAQELIMQDKGNFLKARETFKKVYDEESPVELTQKIMAVTEIDPSLKIDAIPENVQRWIRELYGISVSDENYEDAILAIVTRSRAEVVSGSTFKKVIDFNLETGVITVPEIPSAFNMTNESLKKWATSAGYQYYEENGNLVFRVGAPLSYEFQKADYVVQSAALTLPTSVQTQIKEQSKKSISDILKGNETQEGIKEGLNDAASSADTSDASKTTAGKYADGVESELESEENIDKVAAGTSAALAGATNTDEATEKGKELGSAYISGLASAIAAGNQAGSPYKTALEGMVNAFKDALKDIGGAINTFAHTLSSEVDNLGISDDVTFSSLLSIIKTKGASFNAIPRLASGAVIPPNNPFLAVLGDQRNGYNVEAPVSVIQEAVREATSEQEITVNNTIYLGNTEFRDYIVDTVIDSNLVTG